MAEAMDTLEDCIAQTIEAIVDTDDPEKAAELSDRLNSLDTGHLLLRDMMVRAGNSSTI